MYPPETLQTDCTPLEKDSPPLDVFDTFSNDTNNNTLHNLQDTGEPFQFFHL